MTDYNQLKLIWSFISMLSVNFIFYVNKDNLSVNVSETADAFGIAIGIVSQAYYVLFQLINLNHVR